MAACPGSRWNRGNASICMSCTRLHRTGATLRRPAGQAATPPHGQLRATESRGPQKAAGSSFPSRRVRHQFTVLLVLLDFRGGHGGHGGHSSRISTAVCLSLRVRHACGTPGTPRHGHGARGSAINALAEPPRVRTEGRRPPALAATRHAEVMIMRAKVQPYSLSVLPCPPQSSPPRRPRRPRTAQPQYFPQYFDAKRSPA